MRMKDSLQRGTNVSVSVDSIIEAVMGRGLEPITPELIDELIESKLICREDIPTIQAYAAAGALFQRSGNTIWFPPDLGDGLSACSNDH
jgi:hypothetical protein